MASKRKINQDDLRKMMAKVKTGPGGGTGAQSSISKRYKLSSRELALMEEQKRQQEERKRLKEAHIKAFQAKLPPAPPPEAKPQKSILKNTAAYVPPIMIPSNISIRFVSIKILKLVWRKGGGGKYFVVIVHQTTNYFSFFKTISVLPLKMIHL